MPAFVPDAQQRHVVGMLAGLRMPHHEICGLILNPRTGQPINQSTLAKAFRLELAAGKARMKAIIATRFIERVNNNDTNAILFGMRAIWGIRDDDPSFAMRVSAGDGKQTPFKIEFVTPRPGRWDDDEPRPAKLFPQTVPPLPQRNDVLDLQANPPNSGVPIVPRKRSDGSWMD